MSSKLSFRLTIILVFCLATLCSVARAGDGAGEECQNLGMCDEATMACTLRNAYIRLAELKKEEQRLAIKITSNTRILEQDQKELNMDLADLKQTSDGLDPKVVLISAYKNIKNVITAGKILKILNLGRTICKKLSNSCEIVKTTILTARNFSRTVKLKKIAKNANAIKRVNAVCDRTEADGFKYALLDTFVDDGSQVIQCINRAQAMSQISDEIGQLQDHIRDIVNTIRTDKSDLEYTRKLIQSTIDWIKTLKCGKNY